MSNIPDKYRVPGGLYRATRLVNASRGFWRRLGELESWALREEIDAQPIRSPVYVTALARAGTTIITELLNEHPELTSHRYSDFPHSYTPYWRNWLLQRSRFSAGTPVERAHRDRIMVTEHSPEAVEEVLWMHFHPAFHRSEADERLTAEHEHAGFEAFYRDHIRKLLLVRGAARYLAKGNYNVSRLPYLLKLFPDARFVIPVRHPLNHIASLEKQHRFFSEGQRVNPRMRFQLGASGHYEFGLDRTPIHLGDEERVRAIRDSWDRGEDARGWGLYWSMIYDHLADLAAEDRSLAEAILFVRYEDLCEQPGSTMDRIVAHCGLDAEAFAPVRAAYREKLSPPAYYEPDFSNEDLAAIRETTAATAARFGYGES